MNIEYILIIIVLLAITAYGVSYFMKKKHYKIIDELEQEKMALMELPVVDDLSTAKNLQLTGQTEKSFKKWKDQWDQVETGAFPTIENLLFEAEQATDSLKLINARKAENQARELIDKTHKTIKDTRQALKELIRSEESNRTEIKKVQELYETIRKTLLTQSFSFGSVLDYLEHRLTYLETDFSKFQDLTASGDHIEAKEVLKKVDSETRELHQAVEKIPVLLKELTEEFGGQIEELRNGYKELTEQNFIFLEDHLVADIGKIEEKRDKALVFVEQGELDKAEKRIGEIERDIDETYSLMEAEIEAKEFVQSRQSVLLEYIQFVQEKNRKLLIEIDRVAQSYTLNQNELEDAQKVQEALETIQTDFDTIQTSLSNNQAVFTVVSESYENDAETLSDLEKKQGEIDKRLKKLREDEDQVKEKVDTFEFDMRGIKRYVEKQHLPGLPGEYLDLFFSTTKRIEKLSKELNKLRIDIKDIKRLCDMCEEDVALLQDRTQEIVDSALLTEYMMQYANRYRHKHPEIASAIEKSFVYFNQDFQYQHALEVISTALEEVEPGAFKKVETSYFEDKAAK